MPSFKRRIAVAAIAIVAASITPFAAIALPSTATGRI
ncbi:chlorophyllide reductase, partial [Mesorhizobium sp. M7A.F.Ca.CA.002.15.1.1]